MALPCGLPEIYNFRCVAELLRHSTVYNTLRGVTSERGSVKRSGLVWVPPALLCRELCGSCVFRLCHPNASQTCVHRVPTMSSSRVGDYMLFETLGRGAFGVVRYGVHAPTGVSVAVKVMEKTSIRESDMSMNVRREVAIMKALHHRNVVGLHAVLSSSRSIYVVLDLVDGGELFDEIATAGTNGLPESAARNYFRQLLTGLQYCHARGVVHRDLKPENLLIEKRTGVLRITDFGLSAIKGANSTSELLRTLAGTPNYLPPEAITSADDGYDGEKLDAWACGIILFALLAGYLPFDEDNLHDLFLAIKTGRIEYPPTFPPSAVRLVSHLLEPDPEKRWSVAEALADPWVADSRGAQVSPSGRTKREADKKGTSGMRNLADAVRRAASSRSAHVEPDDSSVNAAALAVSRSRRDLGADGDSFQNRSYSLLRKGGVTKYSGLHGVQRNRAYGSPQEAQDAGKRPAEVGGDQLSPVPHPEFSMSYSFAEGAIRVDEVEDDGVIAEIDDELDAEVPSSQVGTVRALRQIQSVIAKSKRDLVDEKEMHSDGRPRPSDETQTTVLPPVPPGRGCIDATQLVPLFGSSERRGTQTGQGNVLGGSVVTGQPLGSRLDLRSSPSPVTGSVSTSSSGRSVFERMMSSSGLSGSMAAPQSWSESSNASDGPGRLQNLPPTPPPAAFSPFELAEKRGVTGFSTYGARDGEKAKTLSALRQLRANLVAVGNGQTAGESDDSDSDDDLYNSSQMLSQSQRLETLRLLRVWESRILEPESAFEGPEGQPTDNSVSDKELLSFQMLLKNWDDEIIGKEGIANEVECEVPGGASETSDCVKGGDGQATSGGMDLGVSLTLCNPLYASETAPATALWDSWHVDTNARSAVGTFPPVRGDAICPSDVQPTPSTKEAEQTSQPPRDVEEESRVLGGICSLQITPPPDFRGADTPGQIVSDVEAESVGSSRFDCTEKSGDRVDDFWGIPLASSLSEVQNPVPHSMPARSFPLADDRSGSRSTTPESHWDDMSRTGRDDASASAQKTEPRRDDSRISSLRSGASATGQGNMSASGVAAAAAITTAAASIVVKGRRQKTPPPDKAPDAGDSCVVAPSSISRASPMYDAGNAHHREPTPSTGPPPVSRNGNVRFNAVPEPEDGTDSVRSKTDSGKSVKSIGRQKGGQIAKADSSSATIATSHSGSSSQDEFGGWRPPEVSGTARSTRRWLGFKSSNEPAVRPWFASSYEPGRCVSELTFTVELLGYTAVPKKPSTSSGARRILVQVPVRRGGKQLSVGIEISPCDDDRLPKNAKSVVAFCVDPKASRNELTLFRKFNNDLVERFKNLAPGSSLCE